MERAIFVIAIAAAICFAIVHFVGLGSLTFNFDEDGHWQGGGEWSSPEALLAVAAGRHEPTTYVAREIDIKHAAVRVVIVPEARQDVQVEIDNPGKAPMPEISLVDGVLVIDGHLRGRIRDCNADVVAVRDYGDLALADMPLVTIHAPMSVDLEVGSAGSAEIGPTSALTLSMSGCGNANVGDVAGALTLEISGSADVKAGAANTLELDYAGSGDVETGAVAAGADISVAGVGNTRLASLTGPLEFDSAGTGNLWIGQGQISTAEISLGGVGHFELAAGNVESADISVAGAGEAQFAGNVGRLEVSIAGPGSVDVTGAVGDLEAEILGPGGVDVGSVTGTVQKSVMGPGQVRVGGQPRG